MKQMIFTLAAVAVLPMLAACASKNAASVSEHATGDLVITTAFSPDPPRSGFETLTVTVKDRSGNPVRDANVRIATIMASMSMNGPTLTATDQGDGTYIARAKLDYATVWTFDVSAKADGKSGKMRMIADVK